MSEAPPTVWFEKYQTLLARKNNFPSVSYFFLLPEDPYTHLELGGGNGAPLDVCGTLVLPLEWRRVRRGTS